MSDVYEIINSSRRKCEWAEEERESTKENAHAVLQFEGGD